nr:hypothetical protein Iba_chr06cCG13250 [Ipomoea batatas]
MQAILKVSGRMVCEGVLGSTNTQSQHAKNAANSKAVGMRSSYASPSRGNPPRMCKSRSEIVTSPCDVTRVFVSGHHASQKAWMMLVLRSYVNNDAYTAS